MDVVAPQHVIGSAPMQDAPPSAQPPPDASAPPPQCAAAPQPPSTVVKPPLAPHNVVVATATKPQNDGATPRAASTPAPWVDTSNKMQAPSTTRSGARQRKKRRQSFPPSARVTDRARRALDAAWTREVPGRGNPFRTRLTHDVCVQLGIPDYLNVVGEAVDLTLCRERLANGHYKNDQALQSDVRRIHENALKYHGPASPFTVAADQLVKDFAEALSKKAEAPRTARRPPKKKLFSPPKEVQLFSPAEAVPGKRRVVFSPVGPEVISLPPNRRSGSRRTSTSATAAAARWARACGASRSTRRAARARPTSASRAATPLKLRVVWSCAWPTTRSVPRRCGSATAM